jgi:5-methylcytosine-specific restriction protein A
MADNRAHNPWYSTAKWQRRRALQLRTHPFCKLCLDKGIPVPATVADHEPPHRGDSNAFWFGPLQSLCASCHSGAKRNEENEQHPPANARQFSVEVGEDGWPIDPAHPANQTREWAGVGGRLPTHRLVPKPGGGGVLVKIGRRSR